MSLLADVAMFLRNNFQEVKLTSTQKVILYTIAFRIGKNQHTWLKQSDLAKECQITARQLRNDLKVLSDKKLIIINKMVTKKGKQDCYILDKKTLDYRKCTSGSVEMTSGSGLPVVPPTSGSGLPVGCGSGLPVVEDQNEEIHEEKQIVTRNSVISLYTIKNNNKANKQSLSFFDEFYALYPRKVGKEKASKKWSKMKCDSIAQEIINNVKLRNEHGLQDGWGASEGEIQFIPHPATYLHQKRWTDELQLTEKDNEKNTGNYRETRSQASYNNAERLLNKFFPAEGNSGLS